MKRSASSDHIRKSRHPMIQAINPVRLTCSILDRAILLLVGLAIALYHASSTGSLQ